MGAGYVMRSWRSIKSTLGFDKNKRCLLIINDYVLICGFNAGSMSIVLNDR